MNVGSLFSGVGGLDHGLARAGFRHAFLCEQDPWRRGVLAERFPGVPIYDDVRDVGHGGRDAGGLAGGADGDAQDRNGDRSAAAAHRLAGTVDLLCGGFPCQDLSVAGQRRGLAGERSGLFFEYARVIDAVRPRWVLIENVPGLLSSQGGRDFGIVLGTLADLGYGVAWRTLDSRFFGVPQRRRRVFILATVAVGDPRAAAGRAGQVLAVGTRCPGHSQAGGEARQGVAESPENRPHTLPAHRSWRGDLDMDTYIAAPLSHGSNPNSNMAGRRREDDSLRAGDGGSSRLNQVLTPEASVRRLTPRECERLQALPDDWTRVPDNAPDSRRYAALGDAVTATVGEWIGRRLLKVAA